MRRAGSRKPSGGRDATYDVPYEEYERLLKKNGIAGKCYPVADVAMIFFNNEGPLADDNVRKAAVYAIDKKAIVERLLHGYAKPLGTLVAPEYRSYDPSIYTPYDPKMAAELLAKAGVSRASLSSHHPDNPRLQTKGLRDHPGGSSDVAAGWN